MKAKEVLLSSVPATSLMTLFSHLIADTEKQNFSEPKLLAKIEKKKLPGSLKLYALPAGWVTHYSVGILMTLFFNITWQQLKIKSTFQRGISAGILGGLVAIGSWRIVFSALPKRSRSYYKKFYTQLFLAHIIFAFTVTAVQKSST